MLRAIHPAREQVVWRAITADLQPRKDRGSRLLGEFELDRGWPDLCRPVGADDFVCD